MNQAMKQRLTGTLVLGCLALIFIPMLLDGEGIQPAPAPAPIPPMPAFTDTVIEEPVRPLILADETVSEPEPEIVEAPPAAPAASEAPARQTAAAGSTAAPLEAPERRASGLPESWAVRLGVFGDQANAEKLMKQLVDGGYKAYSRRMSGESAVRTGVFVGPVLSRAEANSLIRELSNKYQLNGLVVRFEIDTP